MVVINFLFFLFLIRLRWLWNICCVYFSGFIRLGLVVLNVFFVGVIVENYYVLGVWCWGLFGVSEKLVVFLIVNLWVFSSWCVIRLLSKVV